MLEEDVTHLEKIARKNYSKITSGIQLPNLLETQTSSFEDFLQAGIPPISTLKLPGPGARGVP